MSWHLRLARMHQACREWASAAHAYEAAIGLAGHHPGWHFKLGYAYERTSQWPAAVRAYEAAIALDPNRPTWFLGLARVYERCNQWPDAARAYQAAITLDDTHPDWHFKLGYAYERTSQWPAAVRAYEAAIALDPNRPTWFLGLARVNKRCNQWPDAARAYQAAITLDDTHPDWHFKLGYAYERTSQWPAAVRAYEGAVVGDDRNTLWHYRLGRARLILAGPNGSDVDQSRMATYRTSGGDAALRRLLARHARRPFDRATITSESLRGGTSIAVKHTLRQRIGTLPRRIVHKITMNRNEATMAQLIARVALPPEISTPELLAVVSTDELVHLFFEFVPMRLGFDTSRESFERYGEIYSKFGRIVTDDDQLHGLSRVEYSQESLRARLGELESLEAYSRALALDGSVGKAFQAVETHVGDLAAAAAAMPWVFSHNDAEFGNVMSRHDGGGRITSIFVIDWESAGLNIAGADLHYLLRHPGVSDDLIEALLAGYCRAAREYLPGLSPDHVRLAGNLYCFLRTSKLPRRHPITPEALRRALTFGRAAAELAAR